ncbi:unnamed protein product [Closterium sp. NIES-65]|nr:unnamed protein product [Closterium sp. NIES-65]
MRPALSGPGAGPRPLQRAYLGSGTLGGDRVLREGGEGEEGVEGGGWSSSRDDDSASMCGEEGRYWAHVRMQQQAMASGGALEQGASIEGPPAGLVAWQDTGEGIPLSAQKSIFKRFVQADASSTRTHGGTGIGLTISRHLVHLMGGKLSFVSSPGIGTTFYFDFTVPFTPPNHPLLLLLLVVPGQQWVVAGQGEGCSRCLTRHQLLPLALPLPSAPPPHASTNTTLRASPLPVHEAPPSTQGTRQQGTRQQGTEWRGALMQWQCRSWEAVWAARGMVVVVEHEWLADRGGLARGWRHAWRQQQRGGWCSSTAAPTTMALTAATPHTGGAANSSMAGAAEQGRWFGLPERWRAIVVLRDARQAGGLKQRHGVAAVIIKPSATPPSLAAGGGLGMDAAPAAHTPAANLPPTCTCLQSVLLPHFLLRVLAGRGGRAGVCDESEGGEEAPLLPLSASVGSSPAVPGCCVPLAARSGMQHRSSSTSALAALCGAGRGAHGGEGLGAEQAHVREGGGGGEEASARSAREGRGGMAGNVVGEHVPAVAAEDAGTQLAAGATRGKRDVAGGGVMSSARHKSAAAAGLCHALEGSKFLVVDDNMVNRKVISKMLQRYGVHVEAVEGGAQALQRLQQPHEFVGVFMDVQMPGMNGFQATRAIRNMEAAQGAACTAPLPTAATAQESVPATPVALADPHTQAPPPPGVPSPLPAAATAQRGTVAPPSPSSPCSASCIALHAPWSALHRGSACWCFAPHGGQWWGHAGAVCSGGHGRVMTKPSRRTNSPLLCCPSSTRPPPPLTHTRLFPADPTASPHDHWRTIVAQTSSAAAHPGSEGSPGTAPPGRWPPATSFTPYRLHLLSFLLLGSLPKQARVVARGAPEALCLAVTSVVLPGVQVGTSPDGSRSHPACLSAASDGTQSMITCLGT